MAAVDVPTHAAPRQGRGRVDGTETLSRRLTEARRRGGVPDALLERHEAARSAFAEISGLVPAADRNPDDVQRMRILDTVILELLAVEREIYVMCGTEAPEAVRDAYGEFLERLNRPAAAPEPPAPPTTLMEVLRAGEPVVVRLRVDALSPSGLLAMGQLLHFERGVQAERMDARDPEGAGAPAGPDGAA